jgi:triosephosphate isomerase
MRIPIIAGNWKSYNTVAAAIDLVRELRRGLIDMQGVEVVLCPPFTALAPLADLLKPTDIGLGAQNMFWADQGAYTGEVSPLMLKELAQYVILGHSERRQYFGETDEGVNRKLKAALKHVLKPIVCVGENLEENESGRTNAVVERQVRGALQDIAVEQARGLVIAYEPVWAIGTGKAATGAGANAVIGLTVRGVLADLYGEDAAQAVRIQYGGSVNPKNIAEFMTQPDIDGALVGGASLKAPDFIAIVQETARAKTVGGRQ